MWVRDRDELGERRGRVEAVEVPAFVLEVQSHYANEIQMAKSQGL